MFLHEPLRGRTQLIQDDIVVLDVGEAGQDESGAADSGPHRRVGVAGETAVLALDAVEPLEGWSQQPRIDVTLQFDCIQSLNRHGC